MRSKYFVERIKSTWVFTQDFQVFSKSIQAMSHFVPLVLLWWKPTTTMMRTFLWIQPVVRHLCQHWSDSRKSFRNYWPNHYIEWSHLEPASWKMLRMLPKDTLLSINKKLSYHIRPRPIIGFWAIMLSGLEKSIQYYSVLYFVLRK